ncbi:helix-turn-helix transcriptional regulator [Rhizobium hidalgonense]|uniref:helix-turn-helix transcriptional regulator n=1 Tax=Rhizobium hidalgonense TaxID=1538159 RepID=UPI0013E2A009|nr:helix-turn-helix transcriptional regulator [Rhizobium hidalgonense]
MTARYRATEKPEIRRTELVASIIVCAAPEALRAARALVGLTQAELAASIGVSRRSLAACERSGGATPKAIAALRDYYAWAGIIFLGTVDLTTNEVHGAGACWNLKGAWYAHLSSPFLNSYFAAGRALLGFTEEVVADAANLTARQVGNLERGRAFTTKGHDQLGCFFKKSGVEFVSFRTGVRSYISAGVRIATGEAPLPRGLYANRETELRSAYSSTISADPRSNPAH